MSKDSFGSRITDMFVHLQVNMHCYSSSGQLASPINDFGFACLMKHIRSSNLVLLDAQEEQTLYLASQPCSTA